VVDDLDNGGEAAALELQHAADLDTAPGSRSDINLCHFADFLQKLARLAIGTQQGAADCRTRVECADGMERQSADKTPNRREDVLRVPLLLSKAVKESESLPFADI
jgi:hypothetical protein